MPTPRAGETRSDWVKRCMADPEQSSTFPDVEQRYAVCISKWGQKDAGEPLETKFAQLEVKRESESDDYLTISGYGAVFGNVDSYGDVILQGAFKSCIDGGRKVKMLWQHDASQPIGVWDEMREDENGLYMKGRIIKSAAKGAEVAALVKEGVVEGLSIGYRIKTDGYKLDPDTGSRILTDLDLWETSVVTFPANQLANIYDKKSVDDMTDTEIKRHIEKALKQISVSGTMAKAMVRGAMDGRSDVLREAGVTDPEDDQREVDELKSFINEILHSRKGL